MIAICIIIILTQFEVDNYSYFRFGIFLVIALGIPYVYFELTENILTDAIGEKLDSSQLNHSKLHGVRSISCVLC